MTPTMQQALEVAGWPRWESTIGEECQLACVDGQWQARGIDYPYVEVLDDALGEAMIRDHLRQWLQDRCSCVLWSHSRNAYIVKAWGNSAVELRREPHVAYDDALAAAVLAVGGAQ